jgi:phosphate butyryltransferase
VSETLPATLDAAALAEESRAGRLPGFVIGGPFGYDVAVSREAAKAKGLGGSEAAGEADLLLFAGIEAANAVAKSWKFHGKAETGSIVLGGRVPILLNSRSDGVARRMNALLLAIAVLAGRRA